MTPFMRLLLGAAALAAGMHAVAQSQTLPSSADQAQNAILISGAPKRPIVWGAKDAFQIRYDLLHSAAEPAVQVEAGLIARNRDARDRSIEVARSGMMQRYAAAREAERSAVGAGAPAGASGDASAR